MNESNASLLRQALAGLELDFSDEQIDQLVRYCEQLWDWNQKINLTRHTDFETFAQRDLVDTWQLSGLLRAEETVLDVGTGGGVPGVVLAILRPDLRISVSESVGKKAEAVAQIVQELRLDVPVLPERAEKILDSASFDVLVARAVGPLWKLCKWLDPHWHRFGRLLAIKGPRWVDERAEARHRGWMKDAELRKALSYSMPGTESESVILKLWQKGRPEP